MGIGERIVDHRVRGNTVPSLSASLVLNKVQPSLSLRYWLMPMAVPLGDRNIQPRHQRAQVVELIVEAVKDNQPRMFPTEFFDLRKTTRVAVNYLAPDTMHLGDID